MLTRRLVGTCAVMTLATVPGGWSVSAEGGSPPSQLVQVPVLAGSSNLDGVAALDARNVWAVGWSDSSKGGLLILHWDGNQWSRMATPSPGGRGGTANLTDVAALSSTDVWAVGQYRRPGQHDRTLALHWDGAAWAQQPTPTKAGVDCGLNGVTATLDGSVWAVGDCWNSDTSLIERWDGSRWQVSSGPQAVGDVLYAVAGASADDVWAVGRQDHGGALSMHWDGQDWARVRTHSPRGAQMYAVSTVSDVDVWAVGSYRHNDAERNLTTHWDGRAWSRVDVPDRGGRDGINYLTGVSLDSPTSGWAVGVFASSWYAAPAQPMLQRWDGQEWSVVKGPKYYKHGYIRWQAVATTSLRDAWAVGYTEAEGQMYDHSVVGHWDGTSWSLSWWH